MFADLNHQLYVKVRPVYRKGIAFIDMGAPDAMHRALDAADHGRILVHGQPVNVEIAHQSRCSARHEAGRDHGRKPKGRGWERS